MGLGVTVTVNSSLSGEGSKFASPARCTVTTTVPALLAVTEPVAELTAANAELQRFKAIAETTSNLVAMASLDLKIFYLNPSGFRMLKIPPGSDVAGLPVSNFFPADVFQFLNEVAIPQAVREGHWSGETRMLAQTGEEIPVSFVGLAIKSPEGLPLHLACVVNDISARK